MAEGEITVKLNLDIDALKDQIKHLGLDPEAMIKEFHAKFKLEHSDGPRALPIELLDFRLKFMFEELNEYIEAVAEGDLEGQYDALIDLVYVAIGTAYLQGFPFMEGFERVHEANMKKVRALRETDSKRGSVYDVVKPEGWTAPVLKDLLDGND